MSAGLLTYKLCDRDFDCDRCPLDAGLRGGTLESSHHEALLAPRRDAGAFPGDRLYTIGHSWVKAAGGKDGRLCRIGLDAFAAAVIGRCSGVRWNDPGKTSARGEPICQIDLGLGCLSVGAPVRGEVAAGNGALGRTPVRLVTAPYEDGWIVEFRVADPAALDGLLTPEAAREKARMDLRRFRRRVAVHLFAEGGTVGQSLADGGELITDLRQMLGGTAYLEILRELIH
jgi:glycine cleavage system H protein